MSSTSGDRPAPTCEEWRSAFYASATGLAALDGEGRILGANESLVALLERSEDELVGGRLADHVEGADRSLDATLLAELRDQSCASYELERRYRTGSGHGRLVRELVSRATWGSESGRLVMLREISESRRRVNAAQARDVLVLLGEATSVVSHEVRNALAGIRSAVEVIGDALPRGSSEAVAVDEVRCRIADLDSSVSDSLAFARAPRLTPVRVRDVLARVASSLAPSTVSVEGPDPLLHADAPQLACALEELCCALAPRPSRLTVRVEVEHGPPRAVILMRGVLRADERRSVAHADPLGRRLARRIIEAHGGELSEGSAPMVVRLPVGSEPHREAP